MSTIKQKIISTGDTLYWLNDTTEWMLVDGKAIKAWEFIKLGEICKSQSYVDAHVLKEIESIVYGASTEYDNAIDSNVIDKEQNKTKYLPLSTKK